MTDNLRDRIAVALRGHGGAYYRDGLEFCSCGAETDGLLEFEAHLADAVIEALPELTEPVSVEAIGDYQYVCHPCGSSFSFYSSSTMQQFALMHSGSHNPKDADV